MKPLMLALTLLVGTLLAGCDTGGAFFPDAPDGSFIKSNIGPGPVGPVGPVVGPTTNNPSGVR